jgi:hypothetical protein
VRRAKTIKVFCPLAFTDRLLSGRWIRLRHPEKEIRSSFPAFCVTTTRRRSATRYDFGAIAEVIDIDEPDELVSLTRDLSLSGCFIMTTTPFPKGTRVRVRIMRSSAEITAMGNVTANVTATGMGIAFTQIEPNDRAILEKWLG